MTGTAKLIFAGCAMVLATAATAQSVDIDINGDGMYSFPELQAVMPEMTEEDFTTLDVSGDGMLDTAEITAATEAGLLPE